MRVRSKQAALLALLLAAACNKGSDNAVVARGRTVYMTTCTACHNPDPRKDGNVGPAVHGSSLELLRARVLQINYPPGYKPKRTTKVMPPMPHLAPEIEALYAFLNG